MVFISDIDDTIIFSEKKINGKRVCVEKKDGTEISFMTDRGAELFAETVKKVMFVPITTRSLEQYGRIEFPEGYKPKYAVVDNGAVLLIDGVPDKEWHRRSEKLAADCRSELEDFRLRLEKIVGNSSKVKYSDNIFIYTKHTNCNYVMKKLLSDTEPEKVSVFIGGNKLYVIPKGINKKSAFENLKSKLQEKFTVAAGDSELDEDFLSEADIALIKCGILSGRRINKNQICERFPDNDFVFEIVKKYLN